MGAATSVLEQRLRGVLEAKRGAVVIDVELGDRDGLAAREAAPDAAPGPGVRVDRVRVLAGLLPGLPAQARRLLVAISDALDPASLGLPEEDAQAPHRTPGPGPGPGSGRGPATAQVLQDVAIAGAEATIELGRVLEACQVVILRDLTIKAGRRLLQAEEGQTDPGALSPTRRARWRARTKSVVANELQALSGYGILDCHDRVAFAMAPAPATAAAAAALRAGWCDWWQVWQYFKRCRRLDPATATDIADVVFAMPQDLIESGTTTTNRPSRRQFLNTLDREATRAEGTDPTAARQRRREAVAARRATASIDPDGTGCLSIIARSSTTAAAMQRIETIARAARAAGDTRTLNQLRSDLAMALLTAGTLPTPTPTNQTNPDPGDPAPANPDLSLDRIDPAAGGGWEPADIDRLTSILAGHAPATVEVVIPYDVLTGTNPEGVGLIVGHGHLTGEHAREISAAPGSTFYRLVTDPATGHLVDRSVHTYQPDAAMRAIITAADRYCRGPGCTIPAGHAQLDHVHPAPDGPTAIHNLAPAHPRHHGMKTNTWWTSLLDPDNRDLTWTTFFGHNYTTTTFDYRTLAAALTTARAGGAGGTGGPAPGDRPVLADLQDQLIYAALAEQAAGTTLDGEPADQDLHTAYLNRREHANLAGPDGPITLTHTPPGGEQRHGAPPHQQTPTQILHGLGIHPTPPEQPSLPQDPHPRARHSRDDDEAPPF